MVKKKKLVICIICLLLVMILFAGIRYRLYEPEKEFAAEEIDYYYSRSGSSSVYVRYAIYQYKGHFVFVSQYFDCGDVFMETYLLDSRQEEQFLEELKQCRIDKDLKYDSESDGGYSQENLVCAGGKQYPLKNFSLDNIGIVLRDMQDIDFLENSAVSKEVFSEEDTARLRDIYNESENAIFFVGTDEFEKMIYDQIVERIGEKIDELHVIEEGTLDFLMQVQTESGKKFEVTVTHMGLVYDVKAEN